MDFNNFIVICLYASIISTTSLLLVSTCCSILKKTKTSYWVVCLGISDTHWINTKHYKFFPKPWITYSKSSRKTNPRRVGKIRKYIIWLGVRLFFKEKVIFFVIIIHGPRTFKFEIEKEVKPKLALLVLLIHMPTWVNSR